MDISQQWLGHLLMDELVIIDGNEISDYIGDIQPGKGILKPNADSVGPVESTYLCSVISSFSVSVLVIETLCFIMANSTAPDQTQENVQADQEIHCSRVPSGPYSPYVSVLLSLLSEDIIDMSYENGPLDIITLCGKCSSRSA